MVGAGIGVASYLVTCYFTGNEVTAGGVLGAALGGAVTCGLFGPLGGAGGGAVNAAIVGAASSAAGGMASSALRQGWDSGSFFDIDWGQVGKEGLISGLVGGALSFIGGAFSEILGASGGGPGGAAAGVGGGAFAFAPALAFNPSAAIAPAIAFAGPGMTTAFSTGQGGGGDSETEWVRPKGWRLPKNGRWSGTPGNSDFIPDDPAALGLKPREVVPFRNGRPDFSKWSKGNFRSNDPLTGVHDVDRLKMTKAIAEAKGWTITRVQEWLRNQQLSPHHAGGNEFQLIPWALHGNPSHVPPINGIRHMGGAFDLRIP